MARKSEIDIAALKVENRQLKRAVRTLLDELESDGAVDCDCVRDECPPNITEADHIELPEERENRKE